MSEKERILEAVKDDLICGDDGYKVYWPFARGYLTASHLRTIADELDKQNADWDAQVQRDFSGQGTMPPDQEQTQPSKEDIRQFLATCDEADVLAVVADEYTSNDIMKALVKENCFRATAMALIHLVEEDINKLHEIARVINDSDD